MTVHSSEMPSGAVFRKGVWERARVGAVAGFRLGLYFAVLSVIIVPLVNSEDRHSERPISLVAAMLGCLLFAPFAGAAINVALVWIHSIFGAALTGCVVLLPGMLGLAFSSHGLHGWSLDFAFGIGLMTFLLGTLSGSVAWLTRDRWRED